MTFPVKFKPTNLQQKKPSICSTYLMYFLYKKTPFRVCSFGGLPRTCLSTRESSPSTTQKNTLSGVFFWWTGMDSNHRRQCRQIYSLIPLAAREPVLELVIGVEPTTCWLQISCSAIEPHQHILGASRKQMFQPPSCPTSFVSAFSPYGLLKAFQTPTFCRCLINT